MVTPLTVRPRTRCRAAWRGMQHGSAAAVRGRCTRRRRAGATCCLTAGQRVCYSRDAASRPAWPARRARTGQQHMPARVLQPKQRRECALHELHGPGGGAFDENRTVATSRGCAVVTSRGCAPAESQPPGCRRWQRAVVVSGHAQLRFRSESRLAGTGVAVSALAAAQCGGLCLPCSSWCVKLCACACCSCVVCAVAALWLTVCQLRLP